MFGHSAIRGWWVWSFFLLCETFMFPAGWASLLFLFKSFFSRFDHRNALFENRGGFGIQFFANLCGDVASLFNKPQGILIVFEPNAKGEIPFIALWQSVDFGNWPELAVEDWLNLLHYLLGLSVVTQLDVVVFDVVFYVRFGFDVVAGFGLWWFLSVSFSFFFGFLAFSGLSLFGAVVVVPLLAFLGAGAGVGLAAVNSRHETKYYKRINKVLSQLWAVSIELL